ncbi:hypothetical protein CDS [Bradyrhizobium sp.]|nr:hypothetical protein CDS [Bradyrhizobium sp.]
MPLIAEGRHQMISALPPAAVKASCMRFNNAGPKNVSI